MNLPPLAEIQELLKGDEARNLPPLRLSVLRNITVEAIEPYLRYLAMRTGFKAEVRFGAYDHILQEASQGEEALSSEDADAILVYFWLPAFSEALSLSFAGLDESEVEVEVRRVKDYAAAVIQGLRGHSPATLLWHGFETPSYPSMGIFDGLAHAGQKSVVDELNSDIKDQLDQAGNAYLVDLNLCLARVGAFRFYDWRYWHIGRAPFSREALAEIALEDFKYLRALKGKARKCLVLDCDNVLWGGILGEDGIERIQLGHTHPGSAYREFQKEVKNLYDRGVILALCSKNNPDDVLRVLREHPEMILREKHFASLRVNWQDKASNIREIADELKIGLDSLVFVDDSEFEVNLVQTMIPEVEVIHLPPATAPANRSILAACGLFDTLSLSAEDRQRGEMYRAEVKRKEHRSSAGDLSNYLQSLEMEVQIGPANELTLARAAQLSQRTNQFNLTTRRYSEADIRSFMESPDHDLLLARVSDRFGEYGIGALAILATKEGRTEIDTFLLSCRILGRGVEQVFLEQCVELARCRRAGEVVGRYIPTKKNGQTEAFFPKCGFKPFSASAEESLFILPADQALVGLPDHFKRVEMAGKV